MIQYFFVDMIPLWGLNAVISICDVLIILMVLAAVIIIGGAILGHAIDYIKQHKKSR